VAKDNDAEAIEPPRGGCRLAANTVHGDKEAEISREELVSAYIDGRLSRRAFIRRLVAAGVSVGAAASYAHLLAPEARGADAHVSLDDHYPDVNVGIRSRDIDRIQETGVVRVRVHVDDGAMVFVGVDARVGGASAARRVLIGSKRVRFDGAGTRIVKVHLNRKGRMIIRNRDAALLRVTAIAADLDPGDAGYVDADFGKRRVT